jgi:hypothetical protein
MVAAILLGSASEMTDTEYVLMSFMVEGIGDSFYGLVDL